MGDNHAFVEVDESGRETCVLERKWWSGSVRRVELERGTIRVIDRGEVVFEGAATSFFKTFTEDESEPADTYTRDDFIVAGFVCPHEGGTSVETQAFAEADGKSDFYLHNNERRVIAERGTESAAMLSDAKLTSSLTSSYYDGEGDSMPDYIRSE